MIKILPSISRTVAIILIILTVIVGLYLAFVALLWGAQERLIFPRHMVGAATYDLPDRTRRLELEADNGDIIIGNLVPARSARKEGLVIGFAGNAWQADDCTVFLSHRLPSYDVAVFHYRGYEPSEGTPSERALFADAITIHDHLTSELRPDSVIAVGLSIGTGVAAFLAKERPLDGLVLVTPFDSIRAVANERFSWAPVTWLLRHPFMSAAHLKGVDVPTAVIVAGDDQLVSSARSRALIESLEDLVYLQEIPGRGHVDIYHDGALDNLLPLAVNKVHSAATD